LPIGSELVKPITSNTVDICTSSTAELASWKKQSIIPDVLDEALAILAPTPR
jgi:hypothetical protein